MGVGVQVLCQVTDGAAPAVPVLSAAVYPKAVDTTACANDPYEPNDDAFFFGLGGPGGPLIPLDGHSIGFPTDPGGYGTISDGIICPGDVDAYGEYLDPRAGQVSVSLDWNAGDGELVLFLVECLEGCFEVWNSTMGEFAPGSINYTYNPSWNFIVGVREGVGGVDGSAAYVLDVQPVPGDSGDSFGPPDTGTCVDDAFEPNNNPTPSWGDTGGSAGYAAPIGTGTTIDLSLCLGDDDYFGTYFVEGDGITATIDWNPTDGDLDLQLIRCDDGCFVIRETNIFINEPGSATLTYNDGFFGDMLVGVVDGDGNNVSGVLYDITVSLGAVAGDSADTGADCDYDPHEPNDNPFAGFLVTGDYSSEAAICSLGGGGPILAGPELDGGLVPLGGAPGDFDVYEIVLSAGQTVDIYVDWFAEDGDIDLDLVDGDLNLVTFSWTVSEAYSYERITYTAMHDESVKLGVYAVTNVSGSVPYHLDIDYTERVPGVVGAGCGVYGDDIHETNDDASTATALGLGYFSDLRVCQGSPDYYAYALLAGQTLYVRANYDPDDGSVALDITDAFSSVFARDLSPGTRSDVQYTAPVNETIYVRVWSPFDQGRFGPGIDYQLTATIDAPLGINPDSGIWDSTPWWRDSADPDFPGDSGQWWSDSFPADTYGCVDADAFEPNDSRFSASAVVPGAYVGLELCESQYNDDTERDQDDYYAVNLVAGERLVARIDFGGADNDIDMELFDESGQSVDLSDSVSNREIVTYTSAIAQTVYVRVYFYSDSGSFGEQYSMSIDVSTGGVPDSADTSDTGFGCDDGDLYGFEPNNTRALAAPISAGSYLDLAVCRHQADYYAVDLGPGQTAVMTATFNGLADDIDLELRNDFDTLLDSSGGTTGVETVSYTASSFETVYLRVFVYPDSFFTAGDYDLSIVIGVFGDTGDSGDSTAWLGDSADSGDSAAVSGCEEDAYEPNESIAGATPIYVGDITDLALCADGSVDWFSIDLEAGERLYLESTFLHSEGDIDLVLTDSTGATLDTASGTINFESVEYYATTYQTVYLEVGLYSDTGFTEGNTYDLAVFVSAPDSADSGGSDSATVEAACFGDVLESNDVEGQAVLLDDGDEYLGLTSCGDLDYFYVVVGEGDLIEVNMAVDDDEGDLDLWVWDSSGNFVTNGVSSSDNESVYFEAPEDGTYYIYVELFEDDGTLQVGNTYDLDATIVRVVDTADTGPPPVDTSDGNCGWTHTIEVDGSDADWLGRERFDTTSGFGSSTLIGWDADYIYFGVRHADVFYGGDDNLVVIYVGNDSETVAFDYGLQHGTQQPDLGFVAQRMIRWKSNDIFSTLMRARVFLVYSWWDGYADYFFDQTAGANLVASANNQVMEMRIPRDEVGFVPGSTLNVAVHWVHEGEVSEFSYAGTPINMFAEHAYDPDIDGWYEFDACDPRGPAGGIIRGAPLPGSGVDTADSALAD